MILKRLDSVEDMSDIPIRNTHTFRDPPPGATLMTPTLSKVCDVDLDGFFSQDDDDINPNDVDSLTALTILNYLVQLLLIRPKSECESPVDGMSELPSPPLAPEEVDTDDCPLSPRKAHSRSPDRSETQFLENTPDVNEANKTSNSKLMQNKILAKRFSLKSNPSVSVQEYLERINQYCGLSTAVYLTTSLYLFKLVQQKEVLHLNELNSHRILLAALRISCKTVEDQNHRQAFIAKIGGVNNKDLLSLEISFLFLLKFECQVSESALATFLRDMKVLHHGSR